MKSAEYVKSLQGKDSAALKDELLALRKEQFNLRMQSAMGQNSQPHLAVVVRRKIAQVKTMMQQVKAS